MAITVYSVKQAAAIVGVSTKTLRNYIKAEQLKATKLGKEYRILEKDLKAFLENGTDATYTTL